ncbi:MAG TPA: TIGR02301 family protein [Caulobacteraceae bacterium]|jgi:uncharacterized protein (TIGR02301 family)|nr:TIGR02301 family protein [Caulobacteraceae bacterium]
MPFARFNKTVLAGVCAFLTAGPALAQERGPSDRQALVELAYVIGESHALRQACNGQGDQYWRNRMRRLVAAEQPDAPFSHRLADSFNDGFVAGRQGFPTCNAASRREAARVAEKGRELSVTLSSSVADDEATR